MNGTVTKAVILAAGRGTRMRELTLTMPKPMVEVGGKSVLSYIIEGLRDAGVKRILIVVGYRKEVVMNHYGNGSAFGVEIIYQEQIRQDRTGKVVELAQAYCGTDPFILSYGDILVNPSTYLLPPQPGDGGKMLTVR